MQGCNSCSGCRDVIGLADVKAGFVEWVRSVGVNRVCMREVCGESAVVFW